jgi:hypothetical protein
MREFVMDYGNEDTELEPITLNYNMIRPNAHKGNIQTVNTNKIYRSLITKGIILEDFSVVPFGWFDPRITEHKIAFDQHFNL